MADTPEAKVKKAIIKLLKEYDSDIYYFTPIGSAYGRSGIPDIICCCKGRFLAIEAKAGSNTTTDLQQRELSAIQRAGGEWWVINEKSLEFLRIWLYGWMK